LGKQKIGPNDREILKEKKVPKLQRGNTKEGAHKVNVEGFRKKIGKHRQKEN